MFNMCFFHFRPPLCFCICSFCLIFFFLSYFKFFICIFLIFSEYCWSMWIIQPRILTIISRSELISTELKIMMLLACQMTHFGFSALKESVTILKNRGSILNDSQQKDSYKKSSSLSLHANNFKWSFSIWFWWIIWK